MFEIIFIIVPILVILVFIMTFASIIGPKFRAKMMGKQIKATKYMVDELKDELRDISTNMADVSSDAIRMRTSAIREGLIDNYIYCKYCGSSIESDSIFCKKCGKVQ